MGKPKSEKEHVAMITRHDGPILLPEDMTIPVAIDVLAKRMKYEDEKVMLSESIPCMIFDGALALQKAIKELFGEANQASTPSFFGDIPPALMKVQLNRTEVTTVPWGRFTLAGVKGWIATGNSYDQSTGRFLFQVVAEVTHKDEVKIQRLLTRTREIALSESIYRGKAWKLVLTDYNGERLDMPTPEFLRIGDTPAIFTKELEEAIQTNIITPIVYSAEARETGVPLKRGALLAGRYGTGKTLTANMVARACEANGWTFIYVEKVEELRELLMLATMFQPCAVFCEDLDRVAGANRTDSVNQLLNTLDGIGSKNDEIMTILTSNHPENVNAAMRRPGRIDIVLEVTPPDADAAARLIRLYGNTLIKPAENLFPAGEALAGQIPAIIREVVERAKLTMLKRSSGQDRQLVCSDIVEAAQILRKEQKLFEPLVPTPHPLELLGDRLGEHVGVALKKATKDTVERVLNQ